jgi:hypothetical protein
MDFSWHIFPMAIKNITTAGLTGRITPIMPSYTDPDVEKILSPGIDLVFYWQLSQQIEKMSAAGIPVVCPTIR